MSWGAHCQRGVSDNAGAMVYKHRKSAVEAAWSFAGEEDSRVRDSLAICELVLFHSGKKFHHNQ